MKLTNHYNLPAPLVAALAYDDYVCSTRYSVTRLIQPPQLRILTERHEAELTEDASDRIWRMFGKVAHGVLERAAQSVIDDEPGWHDEIVGGGFNAEEATVTEFRLHAPDGLWSGQLDYCAATGILWDYKVTSVYAVADRPKPEWVTQLNMLAHLMRLNGMDEPKGAAICAILRDWGPRMAGRDGVPECPVKVLEVPLWPKCRITDDIRTMLARHQEAEKLSDRELAEACPCTDDERWAKPPTFAVKGKNKRAVKLHTSRASADQHAAQLGEPHWVEERPGSSPRCESYCPVAGVCWQWKREQLEAGKQ